MSFSMDQLTTLADFAEAHGLSVATVNPWAAGENPRVQPVHKFANTRVFLISDLEAVASANGNAKVLLSQALKRIDELHAKINELTSENDELAALEAETRQDLLEARSENLELRYKQDELERAIVLLRENIAD